LRAQARNLAATPGMGRSREDLRPDLFSFPGHVLFYRPQPGGIVLVRILHGARDQPSYVGNDRYCQLLTIFAR
jgi:toxin ParE1/3/4